MMVDVLTFLTLESFPFPNKESTQKKMQWEIVHNKIKKTGTSNYLTIK